MRQRVLLLFAALLGNAACFSPASAAERAPVVHASRGVTIHAGIAEVGAGEIINFGDELTLVVRVTWDPARFTVDIPDEEFFTSAWPESDTPLLVGHKVELVPGQRDQTSGLRAEYRFQLLDCPGNNWSCPGNHNYPLPEFRLSVLRDDSVTAADRELHFTPWPGVLPLTSLIPLDDKGQLYEFDDYFPAGAFPGPIEPDHRTMASLGFAVVGVLILAGGLLMWPFRFGGRRKDVAIASQSRWRQVLRELDANAEPSEAVQLDKLRRALVWYCSDELIIDVFDWLDSDNSAAQTNPEHARFRALFLELLHAPNGDRIPEMRTAFEELLADPHSS